MAAQNSLYKKKNGRHLNTLFWKLCRSCDTSLPLLKITADIYQCFNLDHFIKKNVFSEIQAYMFHMGFNSVMHGIALWSRRFLMGKWSSFTHLDVPFLCFTFPGHSFYCWGEESEKCCCGLFWFEAIISRGTPKCRQTWQYILFLLFNWEKSSPCFTSYLFDHLKR